MTIPSEAGDSGLGLTQVLAEPGKKEGTYRLLIQTTRGDIHALFRPVEGGTGAAVFAGGGMGDIAMAAEGEGDSYITLLPPMLAARGISSLALAYRHPSNLEESVLDVLAACSFLAGIGAESLVLAGHSFGGAVVIKAAQLNQLVCGVVSLAPQLHGTRQVEQLARPLLLVHGAIDTILDPAASEDIYSRAREPKQIVLYAETGHALSEATPNLVRLLSSWIPARLAGEPAESGRLEEWPDGLEPPHHA